MSEHSTQSNLSMLGLAIRGATDGLTGEDRVAATKEARRLLTILETDEAVRQLEDRPSFHEVEIAGKNPATVFSGDVTYAVARKIARGLSVYHWEVLGLRRDQEDEYTNLYLNGKEFH